MRGLSDGTLTFLRTALPRDDAMLAFAAAVVAQLAGPAGGGAEEAVTARRVVDLVRAAAAGPPEAAAEELLDQPALFAALFQNLDLLFPSTAAEADAVSILVMAALERAGE